MKFVKLIGFVAVAVAIGIFVGWFAGGRNAAPAYVPDVTSTQPSETLPPQPAPKLPIPRPTLTATTNPASMNYPELQPPPPWEEKLADIILSDKSDNEKAAQILALMPTAPESAQVELAQHLVNMVHDDNYTGTAGLLTNAATPAAVSTVLMNDLLNRNNELKLPMLLQLAQIGDHPHHEEAKEMLELFLQQDFGTNWDAWQTNLTAWLKDNSAQ